MLPNLNESTGLLLQAILFSADKHRDQRRKDQEQTPYINHPIAVAQRLWETGGVRDPITLIAALLHDTIEDTNTSTLEIETLFGQEVLSVVLEVSDDKSLPKAERKRLQIEHAADVSTRAKLIKLADKTCNLADLIHSPPPNWDVERQKQYVLWTEQVVARLRGTNSALEDGYDEILKFGKLTLNIP